jgi:hypothetical protein
VSTVFCVRGVPMRHTMRDVLVVRAVLSLVLSPQGWFRKGCARHSSCVSSALLRA